MTQEGGAGGGGGGGIQSLTSPNGSITVGGTSADTTVESHGGTFYPAEGWYLTAYEGIPIGNVALTAGQVTFVPIDINQKVTIEFIALFSTTAFAAGSAIGLYSDAGGIPNALLASFAIPAAAGLFTWNPNYVTSSTVWIAVYPQAGVTVNGLNGANVCPPASRYTFNPASAGGISLAQTLFCMYMSGQTGLPNSFVLTAGNKLSACTRFQVKILPS